jgi:hypothetical protein
LNFEFFKINSLASCFFLRKIMKINEEVIIEPIGQGDKNYETYVNGELVIEKKQLNHVSLLFFFNKTREMS